MNNEEACETRKDKEERNVWSTEKKRLEDRIKEGKDRETESKANIFRGAEQQVETEAAV